MPAMNEKCKRLMSVLESIREGAHDVASILELITIAESIVFSIEIESDPSNVLGRSQVQNHKTS